MTVSNLLRADIYVLLRSRVLWICLAVSAAMAAGFYLSAHLIANGTYDTSVSGSVSGFADPMALSLLGSLLVGVVVASDLENRTVHDRLLAASRSVLVSVKAVMALIAVCAVLLPYVVGSLMCLVAGWDVSVFIATTPLEVAASNGGSVGDVTSSIGLLVVSTVVSFARLGFCLPVAFATRRPLVTTAAGFVGGFLMDSLARLATQNDFGTSVLKATPWSPDLPLTLDSSSGEIMAATGIALAFIALWVVVSWLIFRKADIN
ncbi:ABC transporter [Actinomyces timonensis]|uniref:ABC transporter n=1 Tax=Actinomyces timonensis TaxID=1288391 RepID=UPI003CC61810